MLWNEERPLYLSVKEPDGYYGKVKETQWSVWPTFESWTWPGHEGKPIEVEIYSRSPKVRLYLNGEVVGEKSTTRKEEYKAIFKIPYQPGVLRAEAIDESGNVIAELNNGRNELKTAGEPYAIRAYADRTKLKAYGQDLAFITVEVLDKQGVVCPNASNELAFSVKGKGKFIAAGNADIKELDTTVDSKHKAWKGRALAVVKASMKSGKTVLTVTSPGLRSATVVLK
jgi:beta-galactosidase